MSTQPEHASYVIPQWGLSDTLRKARLTAGLSQRDFAEALQVSAGTYSQWEAGYTRPRDVVTIARRVEMLTRIPATWLLGLDAEHPRPGGPDGGDVVRHQGLEPRTRCLSVSAGHSCDESCTSEQIAAVVPLRPASAPAQPEHEIAA